MYWTHDYPIDQASMAFHHAVGVAMWVVVAIVSFGLVARFGWGSWWAVVAATIGLPVIVVEAARRFSDAPSGPILPATQFILDIVMPLAVLALPAAAIGIALGALLRWRLHRKSL